MTKTVEDILKDEGVIAPERKKEAAKPVSEKPDYTRILMNMEKLQTEMETVKDFRKQSDEVMRELTEKMGELRSQLFDRESIVKETESKVKIIEDMVSEIDPKKYMREMESRKSEIMEVMAKTGKFEVVEKGLADDVSSIKETLQGIRSVENLEKILNDIHESVSKNMKLKDEIERESGKTERFYLEMENKIKEFAEMKSRLERAEEFVKEINRGMDVVNIKVAALVSREDMEIFQKSITSDIESGKQAMEAKLKELQRFLNLPSEEIGSRIEQLKARMDSISKFLANIEDQHKKALISDKSYAEVKQKNEELLKQASEELVNIQSGKDTSFKNLPTIISTLDSRTNALEKRLDEMNEAGEKSSGSKMFGITDALRSQTGMFNDIITRVKELSQRMMALSTSVNSFDSRIRFFEVMDGLIRTDNSTDIRFYLGELEKLVLVMRANGIWDKNRETLTFNLLGDVAENWRRYGFEQVAKEFDAEVSKIRGMSPQAARK